MCALSMKRGELYIMNPKLVNGFTFQLGRPEEDFGSYDIARLSVSALLHFYRKRTVLDDIPFDNAQKKCGDEY